MLDIDRDRQRISLGLKQTQEDPWQKVLNEYKEGDVVEGKVTKIVAFGAFVQILPGVEGLVHISELAQHHVESPAEVVRPGDELKVKILEVDDSRRRLSLSVKRVEGQELPQRDMSDAPPLDGAPAAAPTPPRTPQPRSARRRGARRGAAGRGGGAAAEEDAPPPRNRPARSPAAEEPPPRSLPADGPRSTAGRGARRGRARRPRRPPRTHRRRRRPPRMRPPEEAPAEDAPPEEAPAEES